MQLPRSHGSVCTAGMGFPVWERPSQLTPVRGISTKGNAEVEKKERKETHSLLRKDHTTSDERERDPQTVSSVFSSVKKEGATPTLLIAAYRHRLESFRFTSLKDLYHSPYAPSGLLIIEDVLSLWRTLTASIALKMKENEIMPCTPHETNAHVELGKTKVQEPSCVCSPTLPPHSTEGSPSSFLSALLARQAHCQRVLSSPKEVHFCLQMVVKQAKEVREAAMVMGTGELLSRKALQTMTYKVSHFVDVLKDIEVRYPGDASTPLPFTYSSSGSPVPTVDIEKHLVGKEGHVALPLSVHVVLQHTVLELAAVLDLHVLAVEALMRIETLQERLMHHQMKEEEKKMKETEEWKDAHATFHKGGKLSLSEMEARSDEDDIDIDNILVVLEQEEEKKKMAQDHLFDSSLPTSTWDSHAHREGMILCTSPFSPSLSSSVLSPNDYLLAIQSCSAAKEFELALMLFRRLLDHLQTRKTGEGTEEEQEKDEKGKAKEHRERDSPSTLEKRRNDSDVVGSAALVSSLLSQDRRAYGTAVAPFSLESRIVHQAFIALAKAIRNHEQFNVLRALLVEEHAAIRSIPVGSSIDFYTAMIGAASRSVPSAVEEVRWNVLAHWRHGESSSSSEGCALSVRKREEQVAIEVYAVYAKYLAIALSFYRQMRDVGVLPKAETYAELMGCAAVCREPTQAFAFYHEARCVASGGRSAGGEKKGGERGATGKSCDIHPHPGVLSTTWGASGSRDRSLALSHDVVKRTTQSHGTEGVQEFPPSLYTNLLLAYHYAGYAMDAKKTLEVLVEAGAPLERASFHAVLAGCVSLREAQEVFDMMVTQYRLTPTPHTFAFLIQAIIPYSQRSSPSTKEKQHSHYTPSSHSSSSYGGVEAVLQLHDIHELAMRFLAEEGEAEASLSEGRTLAGRKEGEMDSVEEDTLSSRPFSGQGIDLEKILVQRYSPYVSALTRVLLHLRLDPHMDPRLGPYLKPLVRLAQLGMNRYTGCTPQCPTHLPPLPSRPGTTAASPLCVAVLAADVLANIQEYVLPFLSHYSLLVIPFSAVLALQQSAPGACEDVLPSTAQGMKKGHHVVKDEEMEILLLSSLADGTRRSSSSSSSALYQEERGGPRGQRQRQLQRFLQQYRSSIHLMSLEEELCWSRDIHRYHIPRRDWLASAAAITLNLARTDVEGGTKLYAAPLVPPSSFSSFRRERSNNAWPDAFTALLHAGDGRRGRTEGRLHPHPKRFTTTESKETVGGSTLLSPSSGLSSGEAPLLVLVSSHFNRCGRYLVDFKAQVQREVRALPPRERQKKDSSDVPRTAEEKEAEDLRAGVSVFNAGEGTRRSRASSFPSFALQAAVSRVFYHNPFTTPAWSPPLVSAYSLSSAGQDEKERHPQWNAAGKGSLPRMPSERMDPTAGMEQEEEEEYLRNRRSLADNTSVEGSFA